MDKEESKQEITDRANWTEARPQHLPRPTYWPFFMAMGLAFLAWGLLSGWMISGIGVVVMSVALMGWITELRHERRDKRAE
jgi:hypothetical protein